VRTSSATMGRDPRCSGWTAGLKLELESVQALSSKALVIASSQLGPAHKGCQEVPHPELQSEVEC
jgi:hypothetical protein